MSDRNPLQTFEKGHITNDNKIDFTIEGGKYRRITVNHKYDEKHSTNLRKITAHFHKNVNFINQPPVRFDRRRRRVIAQLIEAQEINTKQ